MPDRPEIVCICGSTRFVDEMRAANRDLTLAGVIVVAPGEADGLISDEQKAALDALHLRKIDLGLTGYWSVQPRRVCRRVHAQRDRLRRRHRQADLVHRSSLTGQALGAYLMTRTSWGQPHPSATLPAHILAVSRSGTSMIVIPPRYSAVSA